MLESSPSPRFVPHTGDLHRLRPAAEEMNPEDILNCLIYANSVLGSRPPHPRRHRHVRGVTYQLEALFVDGMKLILMRDALTYIVTGVAMLRRSLTPPSRGRVSGGPWTEDCEHFMQEIMNVANEVDTAALRVAIAARAVPSVLTPDCAPSRRTFSSG